MKKLLLTCAAALMAVGAWADGKSASFDFEDSNAVFTGDSRITVAIEQNAALNSNVVAFTCANNAQNGYSFAHYDFSSLVNAKTATVTVECDYYNTNGGRAILTIGDASVRGNNGGSSKTTYSNTGGIFNLGSDKNNGKINNSNVTIGNVTNKWMHVVVAVNLATAKYDYEITSVSDGSVIASNTEVSYMNLNATTCTQIDLFGYINNSKCAFIDNLSITTTETNAATAEYTIRYVNGTGTEIKEAVTREGVVGSTVTLVDADKDYITFEGVKYKYSSDDANSAIVAEDGSTVVVVTFAEAPSYTYSVVDNLDNTIAGGTEYEGNTVTYWVPYFVYQDNKFYKSPKLSSGSLSYGQATIANIQDNTTITVTYTEEENTNVVYFSEAENIAGITPYADGYTNIRMSNGKAGYATSQAVIVTLPAGVYTLESSSRAANTVFYAGTDEILKLTSSGAVATPVSDPFTLYSDTEISVSAGATNNYFDYVLIRKTGDVTEVPVTISAAGWATYVAPLALDFTDNAIEAYAVSAVSATSVTLTQLTTVPAGEAIIVKGETGNVPVAASAAPITNLLVAATAPVTATGSEYVLAQQEGNVVFAPVKAGVEIPAGKAYLESLSGAASLRIDIEGMEDGYQTSIETIEAVNSNVMFDLQGRRANGKGLMIQNGKVVLVK